MEDEKLNGATEPAPAPEAAPLSYEADLDNDVRKAWEATEEPAPEPDKGEREYNRDEGGRFAKRADGSKRTDDAKRDGTREPHDKVDGGASGADQGPPSKPEGQEASSAGPVGPPSSWSIAAKASWEALPEAVRAAIGKRESEMEAGRAEYAANAGDYKDLKQYADMARSSGTTLAAALQRYTTMESTLRQDPAQGFMAVAHNMGLSQAQAAQLFAQLGARLGAHPTSGRPSNGGQHVSTNGQGQTDPLMEVLGPLIEQRLGPVASKIGALESHVTQQQQAHQQAVQRSVSEAITKFAADPAHRYFSDLEPTISRLFETGMVERTADPAADLAKAYEMAAYNHPEVREALFSQRAQTAAADAKAKDKEAAARAAAASRSITGSSTTSAPQPSGKRRAGMTYDDDLMADVRAAADAVGR